MSNITIKRKEGTYVTHISKGLISLHFLGDGPFEIEEATFPHISEYFELASRSRSKNSQKRITDTNTGLEQTNTDTITMDSKEVINE